MAIMIPEKPRECKANSLEENMFAALETLPDDYYVVHSFKNVYVDNNTVYESETDFLIFNPNLGIICLEAKAGQVQYLDGKWCYSDGKEMKHGGPYNQASNNKWNLINSLKISPISDIRHRCKFLHAVWFPSIKKKDLYTNRFPAEFDRNITMTSEDLDDPEKAIRKIFDIKLEYDKKTELSENDTKRILREIICPEFKLFPTAGFDIDLKKITFHRLLKEQYNVLKYLVDQKTAVINGAAGTGKTMIAVEKATGHANNGEKVLFLCYNAYLKDHLEQTYNHSNIDYFTIAGFACKLCGTKEPNYQRAKEKIEDMYLMGSFPYNHVIVDEGQDFGNDNIEESDILQVIHDTVTESDDNGTFYVFYDKLQMVQSDVIPKYISDADCKLTLYKNCRNTENIATTSLKPIVDRNPKLIEGAIKGIPAKMHFCRSSEAIIKKLDSIIENLKKDGIEDIVILTCDKEDNSVLKNISQDGKCRKKVFTTCRKFKGLEADAIILVDVDEKTFQGKNVQLFYVGASRAMLRLEILTTMNDEECSNVLTNNLKYSKKIKIPQKDLAVALNAFPEVEEI